MVDIFYKLKYQINIKKLKNWNLDYTPLVLAKKNSILWFWWKYSFCSSGGKICFCCFLRKLDYMDLAGDGKTQICYFEKNTHVCRFDKKLNFAILMETQILRIWLKTCLCVLPGKLNFPVWRKYSFLRFWHEYSFLRFWPKNLILRFWQKKKINFLVK